MPRKTAPKTAPKPPSHEAGAKRLNRILGQLNGVKAMMDEQRYCPDILTQLRAARAAIKSLEVAMLSNHLNHCVKTAMTKGDSKQVKEKLAELETLIARYTE